MMHTLLQQKSLMINWNGRVLHQSHDTKSANTTLQMLNDEFSLGVVSETVVLEDGAVVELRQSADADLSRLHSKPVIGLATF